MFCFIPVFQQTTCIQTNTSAEVSLMGIGSRKLKEGSRIEMAPSFGLGWVVSEEDFMSDIAVIDYLKIRSSYGISKNDNWDNYNLYRNTFTRGSNFIYQNGVSQNGRQIILPYPITLCCKKEEILLLDWMQRC